MKAIHTGPFLLTPAKAGAKLARWTVTYGTRELGWITQASGAADSEVIEAAQDLITDFTNDARATGAAEYVDLIDFETEDAVAKIYTLGVPDMTPGLADGRSRYWLRSANGLRTRDVTLGEFARIAAAHTAPRDAWICSLLPEAILSADLDEWRPPTNWEIRHIVGEGSFTGVSGAKAAALVGMSSQNFRKYTAHDTAKNRQSISFAAWHMLLHRLGIQRLS